MASEPPQTPPIFPISGLALLSDAQAVIARTRELHLDLVKNTLLSAATLGNVLRPLARGENDLLSETRRLVFLKDLSPDREVREAAEKAKELFDAFKSEVATDGQLFMLVDAVYRYQRDSDSVQRQQLDDESMRFLVKAHWDHTANGMSLPDGSQRERFQVIKARLSHLQVEFDRNLSSAKSGGDGIWFSRAQLSGVPDSILDRLPCGPPYGEHAGLLMVTFSNADTFSVLRYAQDAQARKHLYIAFQNMVPENVALLKEAVTLRDEASRLLGYPSHAARSTEQKMAKTPETVDAFLTQLKDGLAEGAKAEVRRLKEVKRAHVEARGEVFDGRFFPWDTSFYDALASSAETSSADQQIVSEYFPLERMVSSMLGMFEDLLGFQFVESSLHGTEPKHEKVWHEDVSVFEVWDSKDLGGSFVGYFYLDLHPREGKVGHACSINLMPSITERQYCATALICNFPRATRQKCTLLTHANVVLLFHELGHCMHDLASKTTHARFCGPDGAAVDFAEAPSQLLEYWFWDASVLKSLSRHYSYLTPDSFREWEDDDANNTRRITGTRPPEKMPDDMVRHIIGTKNKSQTFGTLTQVAIATFDMLVHSTSDPAALGEMQFSQIFNRIRKDVCHLDDPSDLGEGDDWGHGFAIYPHLMSGYDASFYGYLFSKVYAADIFASAFAGQPMNAGEGRRYRRAVLEKGATQDEMKTLTDYLGRAPSVEPFYLELHLS